MTESDWQGDMLRRITAEQSAGEQPDNADVAPGQAAPPPVPGQQSVPPVAPSQPPPPQYPPPAQYPPPPGYQQQPPPPQYPPQQGPPPGYPPPPQQQPYPPQQAYPPPPEYQQPPPLQHPPQQGPPPGYPPPPQQQPYPPQQPPPPQYQQGPPGQVPPYQPAPYEQYPPPQPAPPYEQPPTYQQAPYADGAYQALPPYHQHPPGQAAPQYQQPPPQNQTGWGAPQAEPDSGGVFKRFRRIASEAAYLVGASGQMQRDVDNIAAVRRPIAIMRRVGVLSPVTGAGTSTVTALLASVLAAQRADRVVAVDADPMEAELSRRLEKAPGAGALDGVSLVRSETTAESVRSTLAEVQGQGARDVGLAVVDCPDTMFGEISTELASKGHATVLVVPSIQHIATYALGQLDQLTPAGQDVLLTRGIIVITVVQNAEPESVRWLVEAFRQRGLDPVVIPYDLHVAQGWPLRTEQLQAETRRAVLDLAARVVGVVTRTAAG